MKANWLDFKSEFDTKNWIHYNLPAALGKFPKDLPELAELHTGKGVLENGQESLKASSWMVITLTGQLLK